MAYITSAQCTAESIAISDPTQLALRITQAQAILEQHLGMWFESRAMTYKVNGSGSMTMRLDAPIIEITHVKDDNDVVVSSTYYNVFNRHLSGLYAPDDRSCPRLEKDQGDAYPGLVTGYDTWTKGTLNYEVSGYFGYTDYDGHSDETLPYDAQSGDFTVGQVVTGTTSSATGTISADDDQGTTGTLTLTNVDGHFGDNEPITDPLTGAATANITTHWQGITPLAIQMATILLVKRLTANIGNPMFESVMRKGANDKTVALPYSLFADRELDALVANYYRAPIIRVP